jgi:hypothetical protein
MKSFKLSLFLAFGVLLSAANTASAQSLDSGSIRMGSNGPVGSLSGSVGSVSGTATFGSSGVNASTSSGSFGFSVPNNASAASTSSSGFGPQGQTPGGYNSGVGSFGSAYSSQGATGDQYHESDTTNTKFQGNSRKTRKQNNAIYERSRNNLLSTFSVDPRGVPSSSYDYGFKGGYSGTVRGLFTRGWYLPPTSTGSFDGNTVSP